MSIETICEILVGVSTLCLVVAVWLYNRAMQVKYRAQDAAIKELEDNWSQHVQ